MAEASMTGTDPMRLLRELGERKVSLELSTLDLGFVALLFARGAQAGLTSFTEAQLVDGFELTCQTLEPGADNVKARATHAIRRLREQRMLTRVDGRGVVRAGEFALSRLATAIVEFYLDEEVLTRESLTLLTRSLLVSLSEILSVAEAAHTEDEWRTGVTAPLKVTVNELISGIERRQRGLDVQQEEFQREMSKLLEVDWFNAIDRCQTLLDSTARTLRELNEILLRDTHQLLSILADISELAAARERPEGEAVTKRVMDQIDRIASWGAARQRAWSEYYEYVHRYLRDIVRLDPARALNQRLRAQLSEHAARPFALTVAATPGLRLLRSVLPPEPPVPVRRPRREKEEQKDEPEQMKRDPLAEIEAKVVALLAEGLLDLTEITARVTEDFPEQERFLVAGRVAQVVAKLARPPKNSQRPWVTVNDALVIEQWRLKHAGTGS
ncbi:MAG: condensin subunit MukF [Polyangiaceae bacterium]|nr:condensin subunit MukF [Polyangiaceae bacterium]